MKHCFKNFFCRINCDVNIVQISAQQKTGKKIIPMETASCPILYAAHTNHRRRIGSSQLGLCCKNPTSQLHSLAFFPITSIKNLIFHRKNLLFNVPTAFISPSSSTGDSTSQQLAVLLEVDGYIFSSLQT